MNNQHRQLRRAYFKALRQYQRSEAPADRMRLTRAMLAFLRAGGRVTFETPEQRQQRVIDRALQKGRKSA